MKIGRTIFWVLAFFATLGVLMVISITVKSNNDRIMGLGFWRSFWVNLRYYLDISKVIVTKG